MQAAETHAKRVVSGRAALWRPAVTKPLSFRMGWSWNLGTLTYDDNFRSQRRYFRHEFEGRAIRRHYPCIVKATQDLLQRFLDTPNKWQSHLRQYASRHFL